MVHWWWISSLQNCKKINFRFLGLGSQPPGHGPVAVPAVRKQATQQEVNSRQPREASPVFTAAPHCSHYCLSSASCQHYCELYNYFIIYYNVIIIEIKGTIKLMCLNHPQTNPPPPSVEKLSSTKPVPGAKNVGDCWFRPLICDILLWQPKQTNTVSLHDYINILCFCL